LEGNSTCESAGGRGDRIRGGLGRVHVRGRVHRRGPAGEGDEPLEHRRLGDELRAPSPEARISRAKWLTRIDLVKGPFSGFWQQKGWTNSDLLPGGERGSIRTTAIIATPAHNSVVSGPVTIGGVAFAGDRGISLVEVSTDGGVTWMPADLDPAQSPLSWVLWTFQWTPPGGGSYRIIAKATEGTPGSPGNAQESD